MDIVTLDHDLDRLCAAVARVSANLFELETQPARAMLDATELEGSTARQWEMARENLGRLFTSCALLKSLTDAAITLRGTWTIITPTRVERLGLLLRGRSIDRSDVSVSIADRDLFANSRVLVRSTPDELLEEMAADFETVKAVIMTVAGIWNDAPRQIREARNRIAELTELAETIGEPVPAQFTLLGAQIDVVAQAIMSDPLSIGAGTMAPLFDEIDRQARGLGAAAAVMADVDEQLGAARELLGEVRCAVDRCAAEHRDVSAKFARQLVHDPVELDPSVDTTLRHLAHLAEIGAWRTLADGLTKFQAIAIDMLRRAGETADRYRALTAERNELRGRLDAYQAKAGGRGHIEDAELIKLYEHARAELFTAPTDLDRARHLVQQFQEALNQIDVSKGLR